MTTETIWQEFLHIVRAEAGSRVVDTWFKAVRMVQLDRTTRVVYLEAPNAFVRQWITTHYVDLVKAGLKRLLNESDLSIIFTDQQGERAQKEMVTSHFQPAKLLRDQLGGTSSASVASTAVVPRSPRQRSVLVAHYRFDSFVVGPSNALAFSAAQAAAENIGRLYNPLFIYGVSGLGKTHLLHAIGNFVRENHKRISVLYQPADRFVQDFVASIRMNKVLEFEARYRDLDVLLVDDIQFISKKEQTQEAFFRIFNMLHQAGKQIVFSCDSMPCDIIGLAERVRSRLEGGLIADIQMPTLETKIAILHKKAEASNYVLDDDVSYYIASCECSSIRELEGMLIRVVANASLSKQPVSVGLARKVLAQTQEQKKESVGLSGIARSVGRHFSYTVKDLRSERRNKDIAHARHVAMFLMKKLTDSSLREIGSFFDRKDHTTVLSAIEKVERLSKKNRAFSKELKIIEHEFRKSLHGNP
ncbi:MAG: chromosomal replication initiator protein DnaA [Candidatus Babeliaceae bacterium]|nr:chromosomal replication initiator protein DnaA [Candidatus Babeliaceae bacterium]